MENKGFRLIRQDLLETSGMSGTCELPLSGAISASGFFDMLGIIIGWALLGKLRR